MERTPIILDTDMGSDCDDAGALSVLHRLCDLGEAELLCVTNCISSDYATGCIDAINRYHGRIVPVGNLKENDLCGEAWLSATYSRYIVEHYENAYPTADAAPDAVELLRQTLSARSGPDVTLCCIGPLRVAARLLQACGQDFVKASVRTLVIMGGQFIPLRLPWLPGQAPEITAEYNIAADISSAQYVAEHWPTSLIFCGFEVGYRVITGAGLLHPVDERNPVAKAYERHGSNGRDSWDPLTVYFAVRGEDGLLACSAPGRVTIDSQGISHFTQVPEGRHRILLDSVGKQALAQRIDALLVRPG